MRVENRYGVVVSLDVKLVRLSATVDRVHFVYDGYLSIFVIDGKARLSQPAARLTVGPFRSGL